MLVLFVWLGVEIPTYNILFLPINEPRAKSLFSLKYETQFLTEQQQCKQGMSVVKSVYRKNQTVEVYEYF